MSALINTTMKTDRTRIETLLSETYGLPVRISRTERIEPWYVARCHLNESASDLPKSVIVKSLREHPTGLRTDPQQVLTEKAALEFLVDLGLKLAPQLLASDLDEGILILQDLAPCVSLAEILRSEDSRRADLGLAAFARTLGEVHAATIGHAEDYYERRRRVSEADPQVDRKRFIGWGWSDTRGHMEAIGVVLNDRAEKEVAQVMASMDEPGAFLAFSNGDAASNNFLMNDGDGKLIDFEFAGFRHALADAACLYVPGPMWITVEDPIGSGLDRHYRDALSPGVPEATDDKVFGLGITMSCLAFAMERLNRFPKVDARAPGDESRIQLISTLESAANFAEHYRTLPHLARWEREVASALRSRWPDADVELPKGYTPRH